MQLENRLNGYPRNIWLLSLIIGSPLIIGVVLACVGSDSALENARSRMEGKVGTSIHDLTDGKILGVTKTLEQLTYYWVFDLESRDLTVLANDHESSQKIHGTIPGSTAMCIVWGEWSSDSNGEWPLEYMYWSNSVRAGTQGESVSRPTLTRALDIVGLPLMLMQDGRFLLYASGDPLSYKLFDTLEDATVSTMAVGSGVAPMGASQSFGQADNLVLTWERTKEGSNIVLLQIEPFQVLASSTVGLPNISRMCPAKSGDSAIVVLRDEREHLGFCTVEMQNVHTRPLLQVSAIEWMEGHDIVDINWRDNAYFVFKESSPESVVLSTSDWWSFGGSLDATVRIKRQTSSNGVGWSYALSDDGRVVVTSGGFDEFDVWSNSGTKFELLMHCRLEYDSINSSTPNDSPFRIVLSTP